MSKPIINSIQDLEREKEKLRMGLKVTKDAFAKSLGTNQRELKNYLLKRVVVPAGIAGAGLFAAKQLSGNGDDNNNKGASSNNLGLLGELLPLIVGVAQTIFLKKEIDNSEPTVVVTDPRPVATNFEVSTPVTTIS